MKKVGLLHLSVEFYCSTSVFAQVQQVQQANDPRILLQGFCWNSHQVSHGWYSIVKAIVAEIGATGIDLIWLPTPSDAGAPQGYLSRELNKMANAYGNATQHKEMLEALNAYTFAAIAYIVVNHRVGSTNWVDFKNSRWKS